MPIRPTKVARRRPSQGRSLALVSAIETAAAHVIAQVGYDAASTDRIAARAGVSVGSVYQYFDGKDAIFDALAARLLDDLLRSAGPSLLAPALTFEQRIEQGCRAGLAVIAAHPTVLRQLYAANGTSFQRRLTDARERAGLFVRLLLAAHASELDVADADLAARLVLDAAEGVLVNVRADDDLALLARELARMVARYCVRAEAP